MNGFRSTLQHYFNPLHFYCRLRDLGLGGPLARKICGMYQRYLYPAPPVC